MRWTLLRGIVKFSNDAIVEVTTDGSIVRWNPAAERLFGHASRSIKGKKILLIAAAGQASRLFVMMAHALRGKGSESVEFVCATKDGRPFDVSLTLAPLRNEAGVIARLLLIIRDLTRRKEGRAIIEKRNRELVTLFRLSEIALSGKSLAESYRNIVDEIRSATGFPLAGIASVLILVGGIGIMNIMLVSVTERTREIGIRMSIGARSRDILTQFLVEALVLSLLGGIIGITLGTAGSLLISSMAKWPTIVTAFSVALSFGFSIAIGIFFGFYPARKAALLNPIDALRYE